MIEPKSEIKSECCGADVWTTYWDYLMEGNRTETKAIPYCSKCHKPCKVKEEERKDE